MLDAHQLKIFLTAAETLNFTRAAERLHMSQPSISQHIQALEKHFDVGLFIRKGRSLSLTDAGRILIPLAQQFVIQSTRINETMISLKGQIQGRITISCQALSGKYIMPVYFAKFHQQYPEVTVVCEDNNCDSPLDLLHNGYIHFLFINQGQFTEPCFQAQDLLSDEIVLIAPRGHRWEKRAAIDPDELLEESFILPSENSHTYSKVNLALASRNLSLLQLDSFLTLSSEEAIVRSVENGLGLSFSSKIIASILGDVSIIPIKDLTIQLGVSIIRDSTQVTTVARDAFWDFMATSSEQIQQKITLP